MKKLSKRTYILITISITILVCIIGMYNYRKPINIHKTLSNTIIKKPGIKKIVKAEINANLYRGLYAGNFHFINRIEGKIIIDGKEYRLNGSAEKSKFIGDVYENNQNTSAVYWFKMEDLNSIELLDMSD